MNTATVYKKNVCDAGMMRRASTRCLDTLTNKTRYSVDTICDYYKKARASRAKRDLVIKQFGTLFQTWTQSDLDPHFLKFKGILHEVLYDEILSVRVQAREVFVLFCDVWNDRSTEFLYMPSPSMRSIIIQQQPHTKIGVALKQKFDKTASNPTSQRPAVDRNSCVRDIHISFALLFILLLFKTVMDVYSSTGN
ncbi:hypothetical protein AC1031_000611 [Aphanomyces cochlioides]|nr:hypothetical protein AC1031_000611 [Aphanomyces cochlioides]